MRSADQVDALLKARAEIDEKLRQHKNALTVLFTDVVGSTSFFERNGDTAGLVMNHRHDELAKRAIQQHDGKVIKMIGDSAMAEFPEPASAVRAAVEIERQFLKLNTALPEDQRIQVRIGIHTGVGFRRGNDVFGDVVNLASRIVRRTAPAQILISRAMYEAVSGEEDLRCHWLNRMTIDGRTEAEEIYEVVWTEAEAYREIQQRLASSSHIPSRYEVLSQIGIGGTGIVYKVRDLETSEIVALKVLKPQIASDPEVQENFKRELCLARKITHKNVCRIYEFSRSNGTACTSMEFVEGESLSARLSRAGALPLAEAIDIARQICAGLREAHAQGIVHRDLKPANVMIDRSGLVKIMDFGIARMVQRDGPMTGTIVGTPEYMAPEQAELKPLSPATDIYALGLLLYEMVTGSAAFGGDTPVGIALKQIREYPKRPREIVPQLSGAIDAVIMRCLQKDPAKRFSSIDGLEVALVKASRARRASPWEIALDRWIERMEVKIRRSVHLCAERIEHSLRQRDWSALANFQREPMAMLGVAGMAGALTIFLWFGAWKPRAVNAQTVQDAGHAAEQSSGGDAMTSPSQPATRAAEAAGPMESRPITLFENVKIAGSAAPAPAAQLQLDTPALENVSVDPEMDAQPAVSPKPAKAAKHPALAPQGKSKPQKAQMSGQSRTPAVASASLVQADATSVASIPTPPAAGTTVNASQTMATAAPAAPATSNASSQPTETAEKSNASSVYLEVGFKDEKKADSAVDKLSQLGFRTTLLHKNVLWMQSYHIEVGPYSSEKEASEARQSLANQGFKAHPVNLPPL